MPSLPLEFNYSHVYINLTVFLLSLVLVLLGAVYIYTDVFRKHRFHRSW